MRVDGCFLLSLFLILSKSLLFVEADPENDSRIFLSLYNEKALLKARDRWKTCWNYATNITDKTLAARTQAELIFIDFQKKFCLDAVRFGAKTQHRICNSSASFMTFKDDLKQRELVTLLDKMDDVYNRARLNHPLLGKELALYPDLVDLMSNSNNTSIKLAVWQGWRTVTGPILRPMYSQFVQLSNKAALENNWKNAGEWLRARSGITQDRLERLWLDLKPFYMELHAYVRYRLQQHYPLVMDDEPLPANLMSDMWSKSWIHIYRLVEPYPNTYNPDLTKQLKNRGFNARKIIRFTEEFYRSFGMDSLPSMFYMKSLLEKPKGRKVDCTPSAWNFYMVNGLNQPAVRIKQCTRVSYEDLLHSFHEMGHIYYYLENWGKSYSDRQHVNHALQEAVGDAVFLSLNRFEFNKVIADQRKQKLEEAEINLLLMSALNTIASLPFWFMVDHWRWNVFSGDIKQSEYNKKWWQLKQRYQGIKSPSNRDETDFDPAATSYISSNIPTTRYFIGSVLQFNIHKAMCNAAGHSGSLHTCSVHGSPNAGEALRTIMSANTNSQLWAKEATNTRALKEYYRPLRDWLLKQRCDKKYNIGWEGSLGPNYNPCSPPQFVPPTDKPTTTQAKAIKSKALVNNTCIYIVFIYLVMLHVYIYL